MTMITIDTGETVSRVKFEPYTLVDENNSILREKIPEFDFNSGVDSKEISERLKETLKRSNAFGLAANQCGLKYNAFVMGAEEDYITMFNPKIIFKSEDKIHMEEGCLSFPFLVLSITRPKSIKVQFQTETGEIKEAIYDGISARIIQHEIDHLNGIAFNSLAKPLALKNGLKKREKYMKRFARAMVAQRKLSEIAS